MSKKGRLDKDALPINPRMYKKGTFGGRGGGGGERRGVSLFLSHTHLQKIFFRFLCREWKNDIARSFSLHCLFMAVFRFTLTKNKKQKGKMLNYNIFKN